jgi:hypothetical protein
MESVGRKKRGSALARMKPYLREQAWPQPVDRRISSLPCPNAEIATKAAETSPSLLHSALIFRGLRTSEAACRRARRKAREWFCFEGQLSKMQMNAG